MSVATMVGASIRRGRIGGTDGLGAVSPTREMINVSVVMDTRALLHSRSESLVLDALQSPHQGVHHGWHFARVPWAQSWTAEVWGRQPVCDWVELLPIDCKFERRLAMTVKKASWYI